MRILLASSEVFPYSKTGGLADMVGSLGKALSRLGHEVTILTPLYQSIRENFGDLERIDYDLKVPMGPRTVSGEIWVQREEEGARVLFLNQPEYYLRPALYSVNGADYPDNAERFIFFSKAVAHLVRHWPKGVDIVHAHDWQTALVPLFLQHQSQSEGWGSPPPTCLTIHNLSYQGIFPASAYTLMNLPWQYFKPEFLEFYGYCNLLKVGIAMSTSLTTVSPRYAYEITTEQFGCGLEGLLRKRGGELVGILNGVDYDEWNTTRNPNLAYPYSTDTLEGKRANKAELQREMGLFIKPGIPLFATITRLVEQKGMDLVLGAVQEMMGQGIQFALLGSGRNDLEHAFLDLSRRNPGQVSVRIGYDSGLSHRIEAGADFFLMPSRFEPCGLNQMYSLRYGTVPLVRATGGLDDSVIDIAESAQAANGIKFLRPSTAAVAQGIRKGLALYRERPLLRHYQINGMQTDYSWERSARRYEEIYSSLTTDDSEDRAQNASLAR